MKRETKSEGRLLSIGIDVGTSAIKLAIVDDVPGRPRALLLKSERLRRRDPRALAQSLYDEALAEAQLSPADVDYVATTGDGEVVAFRTGHFYGMTTHARGAIFLDGTVKAVLDVGALHTRAMQIDGRAKVLGSRMTSQCASGSGQFLENISRYLGITLEEIGALSLASTKPEPCSSICAVLAETDVINMVSRGIQTPDIVKGIHMSMAGRYLKLLTSMGAEGPTLVTGGLANDAGLVAALQEAAKAAEAKIEFRAHPDSVHAGALGAALWGAFRARKLSKLGVSLASGGDA